jgi:F-type H+-transporting ATPase subunit b
VLVVVTNSGAARPEVRVVFQQEDPATGAEGATAETPPNPILPVGPEIAYAVIGFAVLFIGLRYFIFPRLRRGIDARAASIRDAHEGAVATRAGAEDQAAAYDEGVAEARAEANRILDAARHEVEADRQAKLAAANARIAERRAAAAADLDTAKQGVMGQVEDAVAEVASAVAGRALGRSIHPGSVRDVVSTVVNAEVAR